MSWNLPRIINNLEAEINTGYVKDPATRDFSLAGYDIRNVNLVKCNDVETNTVFSVNDELEKLNNFEATTTNPEVTTIVGKLNIENIDTNTIYDLTELTRIELNDNEVNIITQNLTFNGQDVLTADNLEPLETKTFYISPDLSPLGTVFSEGIYADRYVINGDQSIPKFLMSDGTLNDSGGLVVLNDFETPINANTKTTYLDTDYNLYTGSDNGFPRQLSTPTYYNGATINVSTELELYEALIHSPDYSIINITTNIIMTTYKTVLKKLKITTLTPEIKITFSASFAIFNIGISEVWFDNLSFNNSNVSSNACLLNFTGETNDNIFVTNCVFETNEFAISSNVKDIQITNNIFKFVGTADSHRYIILSGLLGNCYINDNIFEGNSVTSGTQCVNINNGLATAFLNGNLIMKNNISQTLPVQRLLMVDISLTNSNLSIYASHNTITSTSGFMIFYSLPLSGVKQIYLYKNTEILGGPATGSKGLIGLDSPSSSTISFNTKIYAADNTIPVLRGDYTDLTNPLANQPKTVAYASIRFTPTQQYDLIVPKIGTLMTSPLTADLDMAGNNISNVGTINNTSISDLADKTIFINLPLNPTGTVFSNNLYADKFILNGATTPAYLMSDGSTIAVSGQNSQSNIYLYRNSTVNVSPPDVGEVRFNNANNTIATTLWISHITHGPNGVDIDVFLALITSVSIIYLQQADNSLNYIKYNVTTNPVIVENNYITLQVSQLSTGGSGASNFGNVDLIMSIFSNDTEIDGRLTTLETKTQNITASGSINTITKTTQFKLSNSQLFSITDDSGPFVSVRKFAVTNAKIDAEVPMSMNTYKLNGITTPSNDDDAVNKLYVDDLINPLQAKVQNISGFTEETQYNKNSTFILRDGVGDIVSIRDNQPSSNLQLVISQLSATIFVPLFMQEQRIRDLGAPVANSDAVTKLYTDTTFVKSVNSLVYGGRKFNKIDTTTINGLSNGSIIGTVIPANGINFVSNEILQGDTYILDITGGANYTVGTNSTYTFIFGNTTTTYSPTYSVASSGVKPWFNIKAVFTIRGVVGTSCAYQIFITHNASVNSNNSSLTYTNARITTGTVNTTTASLLSVSYLSANTNDNISVYNMSLIKQ